MAPIFRRKDENKKEAPACSGTSLPPQTVHPPCGSRIRQTLSSGLWSLRETKGVCNVLKQRDQGLSNEAYDGNNKDGDQDQNESVFNQPLAFFVGQERHFAHLLPLLQIGIEKLEGPAGQET
jgi:hypothetical protein